MEGAGGYTHELGQPRWHRANLYQRFTKRWSPRRPARRGYLRASLYRYFRVTACLSPGATGAGETYEIHLLFTNPCRYYWGDIKDLFIWRNC